MNQDTAQSTNIEDLVLVNDPGVSAINKNGAETALSKNIKDLVVVKDSGVSSRYKNGVKIPITAFIEDYMNERVDVTCDIQNLLQDRTHFFNYRFVGHHLKFLFGSSFRR